MQEARIQLEALSQRLRAVEEQWRNGQEEAVVQSVATAAGLLARQRLHEWLGVEEASQEAEKKQAGRQRWIPAMAVVMDAAARAWHGEGGEAGGLVVWIGRTIWPYAVSLPAQVVADSVMIDVPRMEDRLWAIDLVLRSAAVTAVVADGSGLSLRATRRLQLAAEAGRSLALMARPTHEASQRSAAAYRWIVRTLPTEQREHANPRWEVRLLRGRDATWSGQSVGRIVEWHHGEGLVSIPALVVDPADQAKKRRA